MDKALITVGGTITGAFICLLPIWVFAPPEVAREITLYSAAVIAVFAVGKILYERGGNAG